jgi:membrane protein implicated in regulation of membrane protease activity
MLSPVMTVVVLSVLWLIVVVPMVLRRSDERRRERSVDGFGRAMRALGRRAEADSAPEVYVRNPHSQQRAQLAAPERRPVPAAQEALMYPTDGSEMSAARAQMMARRRRSLSILLGGSVLFGLLALVMGGLVWLLAAPFLVGSVGYVWFLRNQALRDRARRENRQLRASRRATSYDLTEEFDRFEEPPESVVRIDDDDVALMSMDTIDLTGLYNEDLEPAASQRRAS